VKPITIYLSSAGAINGINVIMALRKSKLNIRFIAGDCDPLSTGLFLADKKYIVPLVKDPEFIPLLLEIFRKENVDIALPIYSADFPVFRENKKLFEENRVRTYAPSERALEISNNKYLVSKYFQSIQVPVPKSWLAEDILTMNLFDLPYPLFMKKISGSGTRGIQIIKDKKDLEYFAKSGFVLQEYVEGEEYTIDVISDLEGNMIAASPRKRIKVYGGLSVISETIKDDEIVAYTKRIVEDLHLPGPSNIQCKRTLEGKLYFYDINPRFASGGLPLAIAAGLNIPEILIRMLMGWEIPKKIKIKEGVIMIRYWDSIFVEKKESNNYEICN